MLETRGLIKVYKPKKGIPVKALDDVTIKFPEKGMVFLLGKSGSGKSTLLNVLGGLDRYDGGEIIIKGTSSRKFRQKHFDSYRNTYIGFIFQEYNILDEFSVGANIGLALQLQGRKATSEEINRILDEVDLTGYGNRKPNELSGGQKQRVAIARALVKNPQIIMADEPTGALDSVTGKQVLDTLKKLSNEKLVIIVSHDREFAENYADRIIELADGKVISDVEYDVENGEDTAESLLFDGNTVVIPEKYRLTEEDRKQINDYIDKLEKGEVTLTVSGKKEKTVAARRSRPTDQSKIQLKDMSFKLIKSQLPMRFAFKMGASSLKFKKVRLVFTILLSCVAFTLFGLADTFGAYDYVRTGTQSLIDSEISYASFIKTAKYHYGDGENEFYYTEDGHYMSEEDIETVYNRTGIRLKGVYAPVTSGGRIEIDSYLGREENNNDGFIYYGGSIYNRFVRGYAELNLSDGITLVAGKLPEKNTDTIAITTYTLEVFKKYGYISYSDEKPEYRSNYYVEYEWDWETGEQYVTGYRDDYGNFYPADEFDPSTLEGYKYDEHKQMYYPPVEENVDNTVTITKAEDMLGKELLGKTVVGVVDTGVDIARYEHIYDVSENQSAADTILNFALREEFENLISYSFANVVIVPEGFIDECLESMKGTYVSNGGEVMDNSNGWYLTNLSVIKDAAYLDESSYVRTDGKKGALADDEILLDFNMLRDQYAYGGGYTWDEDGNIVSEWDYNEIIVTVNELTQNGIQPATDEALLYAVLKNNPVEVNVNTWGKLDSNPESTSLKVVGFVRNSEYGVIYLNETVAKKFATETDGEFIFAATAMPESYDQIQMLVALSDEDTEIRYEMRNPVIYELSTLRDAFDIIAPIFLWIGVGFAVFASLMMSNFISTSITHKKREIGILRAIGSRSNDVFRIFFSESFIIAMINFVLTTAGVFAITVIVNSAIRSSTGLLITVLSFGVRQVILEFAVALLVAFVASFLPVKRIASKKPIDAIRDR